MRRGRYRMFTTAQCAELWRRYKAGESVDGIGRALGSVASTVRRELQYTGGIAPAQRRRSARVLNLIEREEVSRGIAAGYTIRLIARTLNRAPSTVSQEVSRHGGRELYRAAEADLAAWKSARRPKLCLLAKNRELQRLVAVKLKQEWAPQQIAGWLEICIELLLNSGGLDHIQRQGAPVLRQLHGVSVQSATVSVPSKPNHKGAITMHKILIALVLAALAAGPAAGSEKADVMAVLHQFLDAFNKGDMKSVLTICADTTSIIDDLPPHEWHGAGACGKWSSDFDAFGKANEITAGAVTLGKPRHIDITAEHAYVVVPVSYTFTMKGKPMKQSGSIITVALQKGASGWRISAWAWSDGIQTEVKPGTGN